MMKVLYAMALLLYLTGVIAIGTATHELGVIGGVMVILFGGVINLLSGAVYVAKGVRMKSWSICWGIVLFGPIVVLLLIALVLRS